MSVVNGNGLNFHIQHLGSQGTPLVMIHGLLIDSLPTWYFSIAPRLAKSHRVTLYDLRGHGLSERPPTGYGLDSMTSDLEFIIDNVSGGARALIGFSYGCAVALRYAMRHPDRLDRLVLVEAPLPFFSEEWASGMLKKGQSELLGMLSARHRETFTRLLENKDPRGSPLSRQVQGLLSETSLLGDLKLQPEIADSDLALVRCPVLLVYGEDSQVFPGSRDRLERVLPDVCLEILPGGHFLTLDSPDLLADACERFLNE
jgi:pimeloyl-ACP methyl ester carboxylesterase